MHLLPILAVAVAAGLAVRDPVLASALLVPAFLGRRLRPLRAPALAFVAGALLSLPTGPSELLSVFPDGAALVRVEGRVRTGPDRPREGRTDLVLDVERVAGRPVSGRVRALLPEGAPLPSPGARVAATGRLVRPRPAENPGERGPREAFETAGTSHLLVLRAAPSLAVLEPAPALAPRALVHRVRLAIDGRLRSLWPARTGDLLSCLLLGRRDGVPDELTDAFRRSGTSHFLAISGLHVGILCAIAWFLLRPLPLNEGVSAFAVAGLAVLYAAVTGGRPPAVRAGVFVLVVAVGVALRRPVRVLHLLALGAIAVLAVEPGALDRAGFQLSFAAVLAIVLLVPRFSDGLFARWKLLDKFSVPRARALPVRVLRRYVMGAVPVSLAAWLGTAPIALLRFGTVSALVVPANLLVFPLVALLIPAGLLAAATGIALPATVLGDALSLTVRALAAVPLAAFTVPPPPLAAVIAFYGLLLACLFRPALGPRAVLGLLAALAMLAASGPLLARPPREPTLTVLSVGHGLAVVLETPEGGVLVYDAGSGRPAIARRVVLPWLRERGISAIDVLVLSHDDEDHRSGIAALGRALPVGRYAPPGSVRAGDSLPLPGAAVDVLAPPAGRTAGGNDGSTVLRIRTPGLTVLLPGDIEEEGIASLLRTGADLSADVLILPHHGRPTPAAAALARAVRARVLVSSDGPGDPLDPVWSDALRTSVHGAITVRPGPRVTSFRK